MWFQGRDESGWLGSKSSKARGLRNCEPGHPCGSSRLTIQVDTKRFRGWRHLGVRWRVAGVEVSSDRGSVTNRAGEQSSFREGQRPTNQVSLEDKREVNPHLTQGAQGRREKGVLAVFSSRLLTCSAPVARAGRRLDFSIRRRQNRD